MVVRVKRAQLKAIIVNGNAESLQSSVPLSVGLHSATDTSLSANLVDVAQDLVTQAQEMITSDTSPPSGLVDDAKFAIEVLAALTTLAKKLSVFVGSEEGIDDLDVDDEQRRAVAPAVDDGNSSIVAHNRILPLEGDKRLVANGAEGQDDEQQQAHGNVADVVKRLAQEAGSGIPVPLDGVPEREEDGEPCDEEAESGSLEAGVYGTGNGNVLSLIGVALGLEVVPVSGHDEEEVL